MMSGSPRPPAAMKRRFTITVGSTVYDWSDKNNNSPHQG